MEKYESKQQRINRPASFIYAVLSDFRNFTPLLQDKVEGWYADENHCEFTVKGFKMSIDIIDKVEGQVIKFAGEDGGPMDLTFWIQMKELAPDDTRIRLVLHAKLNMMMKMMVGGKIREGIDQIAEQMAAVFNGEFPANFNPDDYPDFASFINTDKPVS